MSDRSTTTTVLKDVLATLRGDPTLRALPDGASLLSDVGLDSLELLQFMLELEATLGTPIDFENLDYAHLESLSALAGFLDRR